MYNILTVPEVGQGPATCDEEADATANANHEGHHKRPAPHEDHARQPYAEVDAAEGDPDCPQRTLPASHGIKHV